MSNTTTNDASTLLNRRVADLFGVEGLPWIEGFLLGVEYARLREWIWSRGAGFKFISAKLLPLLRMDAEQRSSTVLVQAYLK